jgi:hypothetical protein
MAIECQMSSKDNHRFWLPAVASVLSRYEKRLMKSAITSILLLTLSLASPAFAQHTTTPKITAEQALRRLLTLISTSLSVEDFTPERLEQVMGVPIEWANDGAKRYGFGTSLTPQWDIGFGVNRIQESKKEWPRFEFFLDPNPRGTFPPMTDICQFDYDHFTAELEAMGFHRAPYYDFQPQAPIGQQPLLHGRLMYDIFSHPDKRMLIEVSPEGEGIRTQDQGIKPGRGCVKMILIN